MKITWFGGTTVRVHLGGWIVVVDPQGAADGVDGAELVSGADQVIEMDQAERLDLGGWRPRRAGRMIDAGEERQDIGCWSVGEGTLLIEAVGEPVLVMMADEVPRLGRWAGEAVVMLCGERLAVRIDDALSDSPRLIVLAGSDGEIGAAVGAVADRLDGTGLVALEKGMALEI
jgi:hypothetical protein